MKVKKRFTDLMDSGTHFDVNYLKDSINGMSEQIEATVVNILID